MVRPDVSNCPTCAVPVGDLRRRPRVTEDDFGNQRISGYYNGCECGALTRSPSSGELNLRTDVAVAHGVGRRTPELVLLRIQPIVRRKQVA